MKIKNQLQLGWIAGVLITAFLTSLMSPTYAAKGPPVPKVLICHIAGGSGQTLLKEVAKQAVPAHLNHGDVLAFPIFEDVDGDEYAADDANSALLCEAEGIYTTVMRGDCDDSNASVNPGATEIPGNGLDDDCNPATADTPAGTLTFSGVRTNVPIVDLEGWDVCYQDLYNNSNGTLAADIQVQCDKANVMMACRLTSDANLLVVAHAPRADVFTDTGIGNTPHNANGVDWYFNDDFSMGYSHEGDGISRNECDVADGTYPEERLCWHTLSFFSGGWRCGTATDLNDSIDYERLVFHAD